MKAKFYEKKEIRTILDASRERENVLNRALMSEWQNRPNPNNEKEYDTFSQRVDDYFFNPYKK